MRPSRSFRLGRLVLHDDRVEFVPEERLAFEAGADDRIEVGVAYDYRDATEARETARVRLEVRVEEGVSSREDAVLKDRPFVDDSRRGFVSVPVRAAGRGPLRGRFVVEASYESGTWGDADAGDVRESRHEGEFTLHLA